jgi:hypothetical protein
MSTPIHYPKIRTILNAIDTNDQEYLSKYRDIIGIYYRLGRVNSVNWHHQCGKPNEISTKIDDMAYKIIYEQNLISPPEPNVVSATTSSNDDHECTEYCDWSESTNIGDLFRYQVLPNYNKAQERWDACKFMIGEGIINPNHVFIDKNKRHILLTYTMEAKLENERFMFVLEHTDKELIKTFPEYGPMLTRLLSEQC